MERVVVSITLLGVLLGCDGRTGSARFGETSAPVHTGESAEPVDTMLTFDASTLAKRAENPDDTVISGVPDENLAEPARAPGIQLAGNAVSGTCTGDARVCEQRGITECAQGEGCERARSCVGTSAHCLDPALTEQACARAGCTWAEHCEGEATPCSYLNDDECNWQPGCSFSAR
jgi:hypothetical protein